MSGSIAAIVTKIVASQNLVSGGKTMGKCRVTKYVKCYEEGNNSVGIRRGPGWEGAGMAQVGTHL